MSWRGIVLAGGRSSRMGVDKRALIFQGETLLDRAVACLAAVVGSENVLISGFVPGNLASHPDCEAGLGPLGGLQSMLRLGLVAEGARIMLIPVDMPSLNESILRFLRSSAEECFRSGFHGCRFEGRELPAAFLVTPVLRKAIADLSALDQPERQRSLRNLWNRLSLAILPAPGEWDLYFKNMNTPEDWNRFSKGAHELEIR